MTHYLRCLKIRMDYKYRYMCQVNRTLNYKGRKSTWSVKKACEHIGRLKLHGAQQCGDDSAAMRIAQNRGKRVLLQEVREVRPLFIIITTIGTINGAEIGTAWKSSRCRSQRSSSG